ncbi:LacI family DNA-binding transcriptional regulator [Plantibacter sp. VKM Ac-2880]|uniref:LacI family DNA-binding transcriptional regulator n=1 Tax=Plantibacter sp. VKM Ac-2880 TaxID=2783827 RepID=UPI00188DE7AF|nr:LacI family DNA-binding transcriptional regulator [Plantibacter sp. VKM Ac-2880]MBF4569955.1 LacI family DNA-binding transcriptional regulator [Plantibacter sp. VKM Ac-2880]
MATMRQIAAAAGVSAKTVSRVFNDDPHVLPETRERVEAIMRELDYVPNTLATSFRSGRPSVIGVAVPDIVDPFFAEIARAVERTARDHDMSTLVTSLGDDPEREREVLEPMLRRQLSGLVLAPVGEDQGPLAAWASRTPFVFVDRAPGGLTADAFTQDDFRGAFEATKHLVGHGHRRIAFIGDHLRLPTTAERLRGYRAALAESEIAEGAELVALGADSPSRAAAALAEVLSIHDGMGAPAPATALFSSNAVCTMAILPALAERPLPLVAFGDFPLADLLRPSVTVVVQDPESLGRLAAERIIERIQHPDRRFSRRTVLPVRLLERDSCRGSV